MTAVEGEIKVGEANAAGSRIQRSQMGATAMQWLPTLIIPAMALLAVAVENLLHRSGLLPPRIEVGLLVGLGLGLLIYLRVWRRLAIGQFQAQFRKQGLPLDMHVRIELTPDHLIHKLDGFTEIAEWRCVTELFRARGYWIFMALSYVIVIPERFFTGPAEQRAFVAEALSLMTPDARERSRDAVAFVGA